MEIDSALLLIQNITIVFSNLDVQEIDSHQLKKLLSKDALITMMPDTLVAIDPSGPLVVQFSDRRLRVTCQEAGSDLDPIWKTAIDCYKLVQNAKITAYGFNYDVQVTISDSDAISHILQMFSVDPQNLSHRLNGTIQSITPRIKFQRDQILYDLILEPVSPKQAKIHLNAHFDNENLQLDENILRQSYSAEYQKLLDILPRLFA